MLFTHFAGLPNLHINLDQISHYQEVEGRIEVYSHGILIAALAGEAAIEFQRIIEDRQV